MKGIQVKTFIIFSSILLLLSVACEIFSLSIFILWEGRSILFNEFPIIQFINIGIFILLFFFQVRFLEKINNKYFLYLLLIITSLYFPIVFISIDCSQCEPMGKFEGITPLYSWVLFEFADKTSQYEYCNGGCNPILSIKYLFSLFNVLIMIVFSVINFRQIKRKYEKTIIK